MAGMRPTIGIGVSSKRVSAVLATRTRILWHATAQREAGVALAETLGPLLAECPRPRFRSRSVSLALGPSLLRLKPVVGLPKSQDKRVLASIVSEGPEKFFLGETGLFVTSRVHLDMQSGAWAAAMSALALREIVDACSAYGYRVRSIVPTAIALGCASDETALEWNDGAVCMQAQYERSDLVALRCKRSDCEAAPSFTPVNALRDAGSDVAIADAFGATKVRRRHDLAIRPAPDPAIATLWRRRFMRATAACLTACGITMAAPTIAEAIASRHDAHMLARVERAALVAQARYDSLSVVTAQLAQVASFVGERQQTTVLLAELARALPDSSALQRVIIDSLGGGQLTAVGPHADAVLEGLQRVPDISGLRVVGPIESDKSGASPLERVTARFSLMRVLGTR